jgi:hypothetical protein
MNGTDSTPQSTPDLAPQLQSLRLGLVIGLVCSVAIGLSLGLFLYGQHRIVKKNLSDAQKFIDDYNTNAVPTLRSLQQNLQAYAATHPDLLPVLAKYGVAPTNRPAGGPSMGGSAPGATTPRK